MLDRLVDDLPVPIYRKVVALLDDVFLGDRDERFSSSVSRSSRWRRNSR